MGDEKKTIEQLERRLREAENLADRLVHAEEREAHIKQVLLAIRNVNQLLVSEDNPRRLIERACENLTETLGYQNAWIALLDKNHHVIQSAFSGFDEKAQNLRNQLQQGQFPLCMRRALQEKSLVVLDDPPTMCPDCPVSTQYPDRAVLSRSLIFREKTYGVLTVSVPKAYTHDSEEQALLNEVAGDLAFALHKIELATVAEHKSKRLNFIIGAAGLGTWEWNIQTDTSIYNDTWATMLGYTLEELAPASLATWEKLSHPEDLKIAKAALLECIAGKSKQYQCEMRMRHKDGHWVWILDRGRVMIRDEEGKPLLMFGTHTDITQLKKSEELLRESEDRFKTLFMQSPLSIMIHDKDTGEIIAANPKAIQCNACSSLEELQANDFWLDPPYSSEDALTNIQRAAKEGPLRLEWLSANKSGKTFWEEVYLQPITLNGEIRVLAKCVDITERKEAELALANSQTELKAIHDNTPVMICMLDEHRRVSFANQAFTAFTGISEEELRSGRACGVFGCINAEDSPEGCGFGPECPQCSILQALEQTFNTGAPVRNFQTRLVMDRDGDRRECALLGSTALVAAADQKKLLLCLNDITDHVKAEENLRKRENQLQRIFEILPIGLWFADRAGTLLRGNPAGVRIWGGEPHVPISEYGVFKAWRLPSREPVQPEEWALAKTIREGVTVVDELLEIEAFDGQHKTILNYTAPVLDDKGEISGAIVVNLDISERTELQTQLAQAQKMDSVGRLAGGVAHDFNNMLNVILGRTEMALRDLPPESRLRTDLEEIHKAGLRSADLTRQLLAFARKQTIAPKMLDLNATIESMLMMLRRLIGEDIELLWKPANDLGMVHIDPSQIDQLLANLCVNARDAIGHSVGRIIIETSQITLDEAYCALHRGFVPGEFVTFAVSDNGCGMDKETLKNIFEPFFTTKSAGAGTGLGLATAYGIAKQNNGFINVYSEPGEGATFRIYLPRHAPENLPKQNPENTKEAFPRGKETILLVEDESAILTLGKTMLEKLGYQVLIASTPEKALQLATEHPKPIHLLITDVVMPGMNGRDLSVKILALHPHTKCLFMSGYTANVIAHQGVLEDGVNFMQKPFSLKALAQKVREALEK